MPLSISDIMQISAPTILRTMNRSYSYIEPYTGNDEIRRAALHDRITNSYVAINWSRQDELAQPTERRKIEFAKVLLENGIFALDDYIANSRDVPTPIQPLIVEEEQEIYDVDFS